MREERAHYGNDPHQQHESHRVEVATDRLKRVLPGGACERISARASLKQSAAGCGIDPHGETWALGGEVAETDDLASLMDRLADVLQAPDLATICSSDIPLFAWHANRGQQLQLEWEASIASATFRRKQSFDVM